MEHANDIITLIGGLGWLVSLMVNLYLTERAAQC